MEFGKAKPEDISSVNFELPSDGAHTSAVLNKKKHGKASVYVGCAKWGRPEWVGFLFPPKTKAANFLNEYARQFNSIELNAAYYKIPSKENVHKWTEQAAEHRDNHFLFCPKFPISISHYKKLKGAEEKTDEFLSSIMEFGDHLGPSFLQMSDRFSPASMDSLSEYLRSLPKDLRVFTELRNSEWYADPSSREDLFQLYADLQQGAVITDVSGRRDLLHMELTIPEVFIRFNGLGAALRDTDFDRIDAWAGRLKDWQDRGLKKVFFFMHQADEKESVRLAAYAIKSFNQTLGSQIPEINLQPG
ncbi:Uncharacterized conserved protein YecE, DUF72 family [Pedobacter westerhofensis]|uniref:Uncharacterized conserved protein YecE, DUF72 family n=1 Tax=Pedobacter westerhofensis TaxID=425512 RepID=A0A521E9B1_9SPHI|nr:DUF72 domain-containing protein [Pedobacter westerhofensis]SMO80503.1 Uncharacterized conserved protein YecE, DUF72 family [Pedobacter westerhofensis]